MGRPERQLKWDEPPAPAPRPGRRTRRVWRARHQVYLVVLAGALVAAAGWVSVQAAISTTGYHLVRARTELARVVRTGEELRLELAGLRSVERIEAIAVGRLGFSRSPEVRTVPVAGGATVVPSPGLARTVTLRLEGDLAAGNEQPRFLLGAWDRFLGWLAGRAAEAGSWD